MARIKREGEYVCTCKSYRFPHRFGGGKCKGYHLALEHWNTYWGWDRICRGCAANDNGTCQVLDGGERTANCEIVMEFVHVNSIRLFA